MAGFRRSTAFVIGAGAHFDYKMPIGIDIVNGLCSWAEGDGTPDWNAAVNLVAPPAWDSAPPSIDFPDGGSAHRALEQRRLVELAHKLGGSTHRSIDALLEQWPDYEDLGRRIIAAILLIHEQRALRSVKIEGVYNWLVGRCLPRPEQWGGNGAALITRTSPGGFDNVSLVTFNYDRLAECHLDKLLENHSAKTPALARPLVRHVYGKLDCTLKNAATRFETAFGQETVRKSAKSIRIANARLIVEDDEDIASARNSIGNASQIVFLGFAFDPANLRRLDFPRIIAWSPEAKLFATGYGVRPRERKYAEDFLKRAINWGGADEDCTSCLNRWDGDLQ